ncbi:uncharacterized protein LOC144005391 isoform X2 [Festucalex cinctus]
MMKEATQQSSYGFLPDTSPCQATGFSRLPHSPVKSPWANVFTPQIKDGPTVSEAERSEKHWQARRLLHRLLSGVIGHRLPPETNKTVEQGSPLHVHQGGFKTPKSLVLETKTTMKMTLPRFLG